MTSDRPSKGAPLSVGEARIVGRLKRLAPQRDALVVSLQPFFDDGGKLDRRAWTEAFDSSDPEAIVSVTAAVGIFESLVNHLMEMLRTASRLVQLEISTGPRKPSGPALVKAVQADGGLTADQADLLIDLYRLRNELQHASLDVQASEMYDGLLQLQGSLGRFAASYAAWLKSHDLDLFGER